MLERPDGKTFTSSDTCQVLIASANKYTCELVGSLLRGAGMRKIDVSHAFEEAITRLALRRIDLVITDTDTEAGFDGLSLLEALNDLPDHNPAETAVVLLMTQPTKEQIERARRASIRHVVLRPFTQATLHARVQQALSALKQPPAVCRAIPVEHEPPAPHEPPEEDEWQV